MYLLDNETDKNPETSNIYDEFRRLLIEKHIIDIYGNILDVPEYRNEITIARDKRLTELEHMPIINGQPLYKETVYKLLYEIRFLNDIISHTKNLNYNLEYPKPRPNLQPVNRTFFQQVDRMRRIMFVVFRRRFR